MFQRIDHHFEALLESTATEKIIEKKIVKFFKSPQGQPVLFSINCYYTFLIDRGVAI